MVAADSEGFAARLVLGTAQWGMHYGIANRRGMPSDDELRVMLAAAEEAGVCALDTARAYGRSEERIGELLEGTSRWRIFTKLTPDLAADGASSDALVHAAGESIAASLQALRLSRLDTLLLHRWEHRELCDGAVWDYLLSRRADGSIGRLGASVLTVDQALAAVADSAIEVVQVSSNLFDQRLAAANFFELAKASGTEPLVRSAFLQGVPFLSPSELPVYLDDLKQPLKNLRHWADRHGMNLAETLLRYMAGYKVWILVGCETREQLQTALLAAGQGSFSQQTMAELEDLIPELPDAVLDPWRWNK